MIIKSRMMGKSDNFGNALYLRVFSDENNVDVGGTIFLKLKSENKRRIDFFMAFFRCHKTTKKKHPEWSTVDLHLQFHPRNNRVRVVKMIQVDQLLNGGDAVFTGDGEKRITGHNDIINVIRRLEGRLPFRDDRNWLGLADG